MKSEVEEVKGECRKWCEGEREKVKKEKGKWAGEMGKLRRLREGGELAEAGAGQDGKKYRSEVRNSEEHALIPRRYSASRDRFAFLFSTITFPRNSNSR